MSKLFYYGLLIIVLRESVNVTFKKILILNKELKLKVSKIIPNKSYYYYFWVGYTFGTRMQQCQRLARCGWHVQATHAGVSMLPRLRFSFNSLRASLAASLNFCTVWSVNSCFNLLPTYFFKYTFQQILYHFLYLI